MHWCWAPVTIEVHLSAQESRLQRKRVVVLGYRVDNSSDLVKAAHHID